MIVAFRCLGRGEAAPVREPDLIAPMNDHDPYMTSPFRFLPGLRKSCRAWNFVATWGAALGLITSLSACSGDEGPRPDPLGYGGAGGALFGTTGGPVCEDGEKRPCGVTLKVGEGKMTCYRGTQTCEDQEWSTCEGGNVTHEPHPFSESGIGDLRTQSLSSPALCSTDVAVENPCDPACMYFDEDPDPGGNVPDIESENPLVVDTRVCIDENGDPGDICTPTATGFSADCDPCVYRVCQATPSCCSTAWSQACANQAVALCDPENERELNFCDITLFSDGSLSVSNRPSAANAVIAARGSMSVSTDAQFGSLYSEGSISIASPNGNIITGGGVVHANGDISMQTSSYYIEADLIAGGSINLSGNDVDGDVWAGGGVQAQATAWIYPGHSVTAGTTISSNVGYQTGASGTENSGTTPPPVELPPANSIPTFPVSCGSTDNRYWSGTNEVLTPGTYGTVSMSNNGTLTLRGQGIYYFNALHISNRLILDPNGETLDQGWDIRICTTSGSLFDNGFSMGGLSPLTNDPQGNLFESGYATFYYDGTSNLSMGVGVYFSGVVIAPHAAVTKSTMNLNGTPQHSDFANHTYAAPINGAIWSKGMSLDTDANAYPISRSDCERVTRIANELAPSTCELSTGMRGLHKEPCATGLDCQGNSSCVEPDAGSCSHSPCVFGEALSNSCNDCAERICGVDPSCCSDKWDMDCVALTATVCDVSCGASACNQDACTASTAPMDESCDDALTVGQDYISDVCATMPSCCSTAWTDACIDELYTLHPTPRTRLCDYSAYGSSSVSVTASSTVDGATGTDASESPVAVFPEIDFDCEAGTVNVSSGSLTATAGTKYGSVTIQSGEILTFPTAGRYYFGELILDSYNIMDLPTSGVVEIIVCGQVYMGTELAIAGISATDSARFRIYSNYDGDDAIWSAISDIDRDRYGLWMAPYGQVRVGVGTILHGAAWGESVSLIDGTPYGGRPGGSIADFDPDFRDDCIAEFVDEAPYGDCPVEFEPADPPATAECVDNVEGYTDPTCSGYDLAVGKACDDTVEICNHGTVDVSGETVELGYWHENTAQFGQEEPYVSPTGICSGVLDIDAGTCADLDCAVPTDADYLLMVDPNANLSECDDRRLDNWSVDNGGVCGGPGPPEYYDYTAECPEDSAVQWRFLTWDTSTAGASEIVFSAQMVEDLSAIDPSGYVQVGVASSSGGTEDCPYTDMSPCYADLDTALSLPNMQDNYLSLQVQYNNNGDTAVLEDWAVIYTCVYDQ